MPAPLSTRAVLSLTTLAAFVAVQTACADNCGRGDAFADVAVADPSATELVVTWAQGDGFGADLGDDYFRMVDVAQAGDPDVVQVTGATFEAPHTVRLTTTGPRQGTTEVSLRFPDRAAFTTCTHPGMADGYFLVLGLTFRAGELQTFSAAEDRSFGAL